LPSAPNNTVGVTGTFWQATQPVSGTFWQATQPISAASLPLPSGAAQDATLTGGTQKNRITDGTNDATVKAASTLPAATDKALVVTARDSIAVTGTFWQATQPISGTVTANAGTNLNTSALALDATLTGGTQQTKITDGTNVATVKAASTAAAATDKAVVVAVSPNNSVAITAASLPLPTGAAQDATLTGGTVRTKVTDGTNNAAVKAASTASVAADPALVVTQSPNGYATSVARLVSAAATTNATVVKASAGRVFKIRGYNAKAAVCYLKLYNKTTTPAPATDNALIITSIALKASDVFDIDLGAIGLAFSTGIGFALTGASSDTDATALVAADIVGLNIFYA
jgi:hypothetical protein